MRIRPATANAGRVAVIAYLRSLTAEDLDPIPSNPADGPARSEAEIASVEKAFGFPLPDDLRASFRTHAGVTAPWLDEELDLSIGLLHNIGEVIREMNDLLGPEPELKLWPGTQTPVFGKGVIPLSVGDPMLGYDLDPGEGGNIGQIVELSFESGDVKVVAPTLTAALERGVARLRAQVSRKK